MKHVKRIVIMITLMVLAFGSLNVQAASKKSKALKLYRSYMAQQERDDRFAIAYIDKDSVPELVHRGDIYTRFYTYRNGQMTLMHEEESYNVFSYFKKKGMIVKFYAHRGLYTEDYHRIVKGKSRKYLRTEGSDSWMSYFKYVKERNYYSPQKTTKANFRKMLKKYVGTRKESQFKYYKNTSSNRKKRIK